MKKHIKKCIKILIFCVLCLGIFSACGAEIEEKPKGGLNVVTVGFPQYDLARAVCKNTANIKMLIRPGAGIHSFEPSLSDIVAIEEADVFIYNGGESDDWAERILLSLKNKDIKIISLMDTEGIKLYDEMSIVYGHYCGENHTQSHNHNSHSYDEHIWTSPKNTIILTKELSKVFCKLNPSMAKEYEKNANEYVGKLKKLDLELEDISQKSAHKLIAVADRFPFLYLAKDYGLEYMSLFSGCSPEGDAGPSLMAEMIEEMKNHSIDCVFHIELSNQKMADVIARNTGSKKLLLHSCQNVSAAEFENGISYVDIMEQNIKYLKEALL